MDERNKKEQLIIKICCLIAAFGLWLYTTNVLNPIRTYKKSIPVVLMNADAIGQSNLTLIPGQNPSITLTLKGTANDVYSVTENQFKVVIDLGAYVLKKGENIIPVELKEIPNNIKVVNTENLWAKVEIDELEEKVVPIKTDIEGKAKEGYYALKTNINENSARITGAARYVEKVDAVVAKYNISNRTSDLQQAVSLKPVDKNNNVVDYVKVEPSYVNVKVPIKKIKSIPITVKTTGELSDKILNSIISIPSSIEIAGEDALINSITSLNTETIDLSTSSKDEIDVKLIVPEGVTLINNNGYVKVKITSNNILQKTISSTIKFINKGEDYDVTLDVSQVNIMIKGTGDILNDIATLESYIDLNSLKEGTHSVPISVNIPSNVSLVSMTPSNINVTIKKKVVETINGN
ncbi:YbbR domain-containing protein [Clostridium pascui]|uniref:CdaR family protein n=1 Tax=Clostridium pascui TaxID=46609 RepID=UPI001958BE32|nr:CdaR family protein [Clostridium pascui]MBM7869660.1 YbbR domain-containing protein [Clostridium pascui]